MACTYQPLVFHKLLLKPQKTDWFKQQYVESQEIEKMIFLFKSSGYVLALIVAFTLFLTGCATSDATLRESGHGEAYIQGFHDGRHSGMKEAGNYLEHMVKDTQRFAEDAKYRDGWLAGEAEGIRIQQEANSASGAYSGYKIGKEVEKSQPDADAIGRDVMKDVDSSTLQNLYKK